MQKAGAKTAKKGLPFLQGECADLFTNLVVFLSRVRLGLNTRDGRVAGDDDGHDASGGLNSEGQRGDIKQQQVVGGLGAGAGEDGSLHGGTVGNCLIGVERSAQLLATEELLKQLLHLGHAGRSSDQHDVVDLRRLHLAVLEHLLHGLQTLGEVHGVQRLELGAGEGVGEVNQLGLSLA